MLRSKRKLWVFGLLTLAITLSTGTVAFALASRPVNEDASVYLLDGDFNQNTDKLRAEAGTLNCAASRTRWSYLKWNVADAQGKPVDYAKITLTADLVNLGASPQGGVFVGLYQTTDGWTESTVTANNGPAIGSLIVSVPIPVSPGPIVFEGTSLANYIMGEANGDGIASMVVALSGNCGEASVLVRMWSKDQSANPDAVPALELRAGGPTAVTLADTGAQPANSLPLYAGLAVLALIAVVGVGVSRRRTAAR
ncbi:MAG: hypothetical protein BWY52_01978 [Chloroflexi bacterium ADurb.Bin325]|nr:MAG: hypothetical protein BWY52_01978 [Chloroflexi bacterium ADurb.Bin325]